MWLTGPAAPRHVGSSQTRARTHVPCIGRQTLNHCATREAPSDLLRSQKTDSLSGSVKLESINQLLRSPVSEGRRLFSGMQITSAGTGNISQPLPFPLPPVPELASISVVPQITRRPAGPGVGGGRGGSTRSATSTSSRPSPSP